MAAETYKNTTGHPIDLDDGTVIAAGEIIENPDTRGPLAKNLIESGQLVRSSSVPTGAAADSRRKARDRREQEAMEAGPTEAPLPSERAEIEEENA